MAFNQADLNVCLNLVKSEVSLVVATVRHRGAMRFDRAFMISGVLIAGAYFGVYRPPQEKISRLTAQIDAARAMSEASAAYQEVRGQLAGSYGTLPPLKDQQQWLSNAMLDSLRADNLTPDLFGRVVETEGDGFIFQTSTVQLTLGFEAIYSWLLRLESATPLMHIGSLEIVKKPDILGMNGVSASVMTAIPKKRFN